MAELLGEHHYQMDPKGRISLPVKFRDAFAEGVYLTLGQDECLYAFPLEQWQRARDEVEARTIAEPRNRAYARVFFGNAERMDLDPQGRLVVPRKLREKVRLGREVAVVGVADRLEIWPRDVWERYTQTHEGSYASGSLRPEGA
ncbi:MAG TPA: division/cell wall cluster transcriptional repressor MraZ [Actinomycetota bacterium]|nr:division/cell wall cluster transcriptional repressor MraZ [Actinomycetota bacterium]